MQRSLLALIATAVLVFAAGVTPTAGQNGSPGSAPQQPYPPSDMTVTVTAADIDRLADAIETLSHCEDPLIAGLAEKMPTLAFALTEPPRGRTAYTVGPLVSEEERSIKLRRYLEKFSGERGPIRLELRTSWTDSDPGLFTFTVPRFLEMLASMAKGPLVQVTELQRRQLLFIGRMVVDLNGQAGGIIPDRDIFGALAGGFRDTSVSGRLTRIVQAMADAGGTYDLVPRDSLDDVDGLATAGFIVPATASDPRRVSVTFNGQPYTTTADDLVWSLLRFFPGDKSNDWAIRAKARSRGDMGRNILEYLQMQVARQAAQQARARLMP